MILNLLLLATYLTGSNFLYEKNSYFDGKICDITEKKTKSNENNLNEWDLSIDYNLLKKENKTDEEIIAELYKKQQNNQRYSVRDFDLTDDEFWVIVLNLWPHQYSTAYELTCRAVDQTYDYYSREEHNDDDGDAFRHTYWSALLAYEFGDDFSNELTTAHESEAPDDLGKEMDLHNNKNGIYLFHEWESKFSATSTDPWSDIGEFIFHCIANGEIYDCIKVNASAQELIYTNIGCTNLSKFSIRSFINEILVTDYEFEQQYFFYNKSKNINTFGGSVVATKRLRTGYIEEEYIVLSPRRSGAGFAFLEYEFESPINSICVDLSLWSNQEYLDPNTCNAFISSSLDGSVYERDLNLLNDIVLTTNRNNPIQYRINFPFGTKYIKFSASSPALGERNKGRICIGKIDVLFANLSY